MLKLPIHNTKNLISLDTRICTLIQAPGKTGKTLLASDLDLITRKYRQKPTLFIAVESSQGGGTMTLKDLGIQYVTPKSYTEFEGLLSDLATDKEFGGVVLDNATDYTDKLVRPHALKFPAKERDLGAREVGVPVRSDYQTMGGIARAQLNRLVNLTNESTPVDCRKDIIVTALERSKSDSNGMETAIVPDLPGALSSVAPALFQSVVSIRIERKVIPDPTNPKAAPRIVMQRVLQCKPDALRNTDDRTGIWQHGSTLTNDDGKSNQGLLRMYEEWLKVNGLEVR